MRDYIVEQITYPSGGILEIYKSGRTEYKPSQRYFEYKESKQLKKSNLSLTQRTIAYNRKKLLFNENRCISGERMLDRLLEVKTKFDFTKETNKRWKK